MTCPFISQAEFARELGVSVSRVTYLVTHGVVKSETIGAHRVIYRASAAQYVRRRAERRLGAAARKAARTSAHASA